MAQKDRLNSPHLLDPFECLVEGDDRWRQVLYGLWPAAVVGDACGKRLLFLYFFLCLSRACLGKLISFHAQNGSKKGVSRTQLPDEVSLVNVARLQKCRFASTFRMRVPSLSW